MHQYIDILIYYIQNIDILSNTFDIWHFEVYDVNNYITSPWFTKSTWKFCQIVEYIIQ
jgi:hypothetical protein